MLKKSLTLDSLHAALSNSLRFTVKASIVKSLGIITEMTVQMHMTVDNWNHNGAETAPIRVVASGKVWPGAGRERGPGWVILRQETELSGNIGAFAGDCLLLETSELAAFSVDDLAALAVPVVLAVAEREDFDPTLADAADGYVFADDDAVAMAAVFGAVTARSTGLQVPDLSDGTARTINALSAEASRIADALMRLAETKAVPAAAEQPVDAGMIRRLIKVRRDRDRFFPAEIFADPAWDMLLDLSAARLEGKTVPVSSLCIAAAVPTTTALRWIRSLTEAGLFERRVDPGDARRTWIFLSQGAADAMLAYLRLFGGQFLAR